MTYVMSDLHGCYREYLEALETIGFSDRDTLYILGDVVDRGPEPIPLLQDMIARPNVIPLIGNHEYMAMQVLSRLCVEITEENADRHLTAEDITGYANWCLNGGDKTAAQFRALSREEQRAILDYLSEFSLYEEVRVGLKRFVLVHAGLDHFDRKRPLEDYDLTEMIFHAPDFGRTYYRTKYLVTGHVPTASIDKASSGRILERNHHIAIDCGCVFGLALGVYCLENGRKWYIKSRKEA